LVLALEDSLLAIVNFVRQSAIFLVFTGLKLLVGVLGNQLFLGLNLQLKILLLRLDTSGFSLQSLQLRVGTGGFGLHGLSRGLNMGQFVPRATNLPVAVLQDQQFFNCIKHVLS